MIEVKVFTHGSIVNFQQSAREMFIRDLKRLIDTQLTLSTSILFGTIDLNTSELRLFGRMQSIEMTEEINLYNVVFQTTEGKELNVYHQLDTLLISHDACFDIIENSQKLEYQVIYITFYLGVTEEETTYFLASEHSVKNPLEYVIEFWQQVSEVGRNVDFNVTGCSAYDRRFH